MKKHAEKNWHAVCMRFASDMFFRYFSNTHMHLFTVSETKCKPHWHWTADRWIRYLQMGDCVCVCVFWHLALSGSTLHHLFNSRSSCVSYLEMLYTCNTPDLSLRYSSWRKQHKLRGFMGNLSSGTSWENKSEISIWTKTFLVKFFQKIKHDLSCCHFIALYS